MGYSPEGVSIESLFKADSVAQIDEVTIGKRTCAADFSLLNLPKGKSLGRSKPATNS